MLTPFVQQIMPQKYSAVHCIYWLSSNNSI